MTVHYTEPGSTWWPVLWGPLFCAAGALTEFLTGPVHWVAWALLAAVLAALTAGWVRARRRVCSVELTDEHLRLGTETLAVQDIARVTDVESTDAARPVGGEFTVPRKTEEVPLVLIDGRTVLAWARDGAALTAALAALVERFDMR